MQEAIVEAYPEADFELFVVWIDVLPFDGERAARKTARILSADRQIRHFHDPHQLVGDALADSLGWNNLAWDIYVAYPAGARWATGLPKAHGFVHQLSRRSDDPHFFPGEKLAPALRRLTANLLAAQKSGPPRAQR